ncbi:TrkA C-terminal domain-containing protein [Aliiglaciecola sp. CAU 1673]|uniref:cation:proton antiporter regulatory subunit n=1 Tax=Aliiglaciecola sp. CAU 1673 TaxID=3032595 RepID=UPI0023D9EC3B|nr:TrkA C-terminal domain-containing protein [Aliiglaciecola sp. CAU 1673]MDF2179186.1 TrkA C-terminal domain-containing protein [Aliiglaciecola sp. CAU 1673]
MIDYIAAQVDFPEIDVRQRLTVSKGYGVSELIVPEGSYLVGKSFSESGLSDLDINILTLYRGNKVIPNPKSSRIFEAADKLLCFGKLESMRTLIPKKTVEERAPKVEKLNDINTQ